MAEDIVPGKRVYDDKGRPCVEAINRRTGEVVCGMSYNPEVFKSEEGGLRFAEALIKICLK